MKSQKKIKIATVICLISIAILITILIIYAHPAAPAATESPTETGATITAES